jgi:predicted dehydrogenase
VRWTEPLRVGVIGHGVMGRRRSALVAAHPLLRLALVCDAEPGALAGLPPGARGLRRWEEALEEPLDAVFLCLPNHLNAAVTCAGLERGLHVFCEKPPAMSAAELDAVGRALDRRPGRVLLYGFNHRHHGSVRDALALVRSGQLGRVLHLRGVYGKSAVTEVPGSWRADRGRAGGGILLDQGIHMLDLMRCFAGEFEAVHAVVRGRERGLEEDAFALLQARGGAVAQLHSSATCWRHRFELHVGCERGALQLDGVLSGSMSYAPEILRVWRRDPETGRAGEPRETRYAEDPSWAIEVDAFARAVLEGRPPRDGGLDDARATLALVERIYAADAAWEAR